jgi:hypothetical protein
VALCRFIANRRFRGKYRLHLQGKKIRERGTRVSMWPQILHSSILVWNAKAQYRSGISAVRFPCKAIQRSFGIILKLLSFAREPAKREACEVSQWDAPTDSSMWFVTHGVQLINYSGGVESNWVHSALRPQIGLLCQARVIMMMEKLVEWWAGETEVLGENLPQCRFAHHKSHMTRTGFEPGPPRWEASD